MASKSIIFGSIDGISKAEFARLEPELQQCFDQISWNNDTLVIKSEKRHTKLKSTIHKIAGAIADQKFGALMYVGNETVACIYIGPKQVATKKFVEPQPPEWWGGAQPMNTAKADSL